MFAVGAESSVERSFTPKEVWFVCVNNREGFECDVGNNLLKGIELTVTVIRL